jgi:ABC-type multidrug transport system ATPase subunit
MKIKNLYIHDYKNLKEVNFGFNPENLTVVQVGHNGLGKSNFLESLAEIFSGLRTESFEELKSWATKKFGYRINYLVYNFEVEINCSTNDFSCKIQTVESGWRDVDERQFNRGKQDILPTYVVGYYSGENKRFKTIINNYEEGVWKTLKEQKNVDENFRSLFYTDPEYSQILLLTMVLYKDYWKDKRIDSLFKDFTSFENVIGLSITFKNPIWYKRRNLVVSGKNISVHNIIENRLDGYEYPFWNIKGTANEFINILYENSYLQIPYDVDDELDPNKLENLALDEIDFTSIIDEVRSTFKTPLDFFYMIDSLRVIGAIDVIDILTKIKSVSSPIHVNELSEGEQQLFTVLGVLLLFGNDETLFLLDEPDTHINPVWQRKYIELLKEFNLADKSSHIFFSTHNPVVVQEIDDTDVVLFTEEGARCLNKDELKKIKNFRLDNLIMSPLFGLETGYGSVHATYVQKRTEIIMKGELTESDKKELNELLEQLDYLATGETIEEIEDSILIRKYANKLREILL